jgi:hypothetical protein
MPTIRCSSLALAALLLVGCPATPDSAATGDSDTLPASTSTRPEACDRFTSLGHFGVELHSGGAGFSGYFLEGPSPMTSDELITHGDCTLHGWERQPSCDPPCEGETICGFGDECRAWPGNIDVGTLRVLGTTPELEIEPTDWFSYYYTEAWTEPYSVGDTLTLQAEGSSWIEAFGLNLAGSPSLELERFELTMVAGQPLVVPWDPPGGPDGMRMRLRLSIDHHATTPAYALCDSSASAGEVTVSAAIVDGLIEAGATGIGTYVESSSLTLASEAWAETSAGCVVFETTSGQHFDVETVP